MSKEGEPVAIGPSDLWPLGRPDLAIWSFLLARTGTLLVGGLEHEWIIFPSYWEGHHPN